MLFPLHRLLYLGLFVAVNFWSIFVRLTFSGSLNLGLHQTADRSTILT